MSVKMTVLEMVQDILSSLNSDEVNSISDTEDAEQVASILKNTYLAIITKNEWPHTRRVLTINPRSDNNFPTHMVIKEELKELISVYYNVIKSGETQKKYQQVHYMDPDTFLRKINKRNNDEADVDVIIDDSGIELLIKNDKHPEYFTSFDDVNLVFDSYDSVVDTTLRQSKFQATGYIIPEFTLSNTFVPDLPADGFSLLLEEATSRAQWKMRQLIDTKAEQESARQMRRQSQKSWTVGGGNVFPNYGRGNSRGI